MNEQRNEIDFLFHLKYDWRYLMLVVQYHNWTYRTFGTGGIMNCISEALSFVINFGRSTLIPAAQQVTPTTPGNDSDDDLLNSVSIKIGALFKHHGSLLKVLNHDHITGSTTCRVLSRTLLGKHVTIADPEYVMRSIGCLNKNHRGRK